LDPRPGEGEINNAQRLPKDPGADAQGKHRKSVVWEERERLELTSPNKGPVYAGTRLERKKNTGGKLPMGGGGWVSLSGCKREVDNFLKGETGEVVGQLGKRAVGGKSVGR